MSGTLMAVYQIMQSTNATSSHNTTQEEEAFVLRKIEWALGGITSASAVSATELKAVKQTGVVIDIKQQGTSLVMQEGASGTFLPLTTPNTKVSSVQFSAIPASGSGPSGMSATIIIDTKTFTTTKYVRN